VNLKNPEDFLKVKETLSRIGLASKKDSTLYQSCHILHKQGKYYIVHFKECDIARRNRIVNLLDEWDLIEQVDLDKTETPEAPLNQIKIIPFKEKDKWNLVTKYTIGNRY
jgi:hypothetical protein